AFIVAPAETSQQREAGIKFNFGGMFSGTVAAFDIDRQNVPYTTAAFTGALSSQKSRGFETDLVFQPNSNWSVLASYGYV
ncbi:TonB-dependent receptor domain-containing protein, partial [Escherichia coli]|uniref:TonB-dependent receptor domain-containing protein n=1 Tax=Escherichia coli TaxID=562 RepID=UPI00398D2AC9